MRAQEGRRFPEKRGGRQAGTLRLDDPLTKSAMAGLDIADECVAETRRFCNGLVALVRLWDAGRLNALPDRRLNKHDASRLLRIRLAELAKGGAE